MTTVGSSIWLQAVSHRGLRRYLHVMPILLHFVGKKKVIRVVKKTRSNNAPAGEGAANGVGNGKAPNGLSMSRSSSSGGLQSMPLPLDGPVDSDDC